MSFVSFAEVSAYSGQYRYIDRTLGSSSVKDGIYYDVKTSNILLYSTIAVALYRQTKHDLIFREGEKSVQCARLLGQPID